MNKHVEYPYNEILLSDKKEQITDSHSNMNKSQNLFAEWKKPDTELYML